ncbi:two-component system sensor histidine kinase DesK [Leucobacter luti]|uniref:sensor histidine kinase n=1 Tax=Leucobacter luti TaxID=340320 RepID=UPI001053BD05|nr:histidine kinase [Leucobacter luti]MCW2287068.1 two-component system sensor histidine kinase DesK [Leucobacter luti]TCK41292.1 two-component system sensor histidine kinase DesK [Leucobacter luti]
MSAHTKEPTPGAGVNATWNYTLGSIVFLFVAMDLIIILDLLGRFSETRSGTDLALVTVCSLAAAVRIRFCWFLRDRRDGALPETWWTVALFAPALVAWGLAFVAPETALFATVQLWLSGVLWAFFVRWRLRLVALALLLGVVVTPVAVHAAQGIPQTSQIFGALSGFVLFYGVMLPAMLYASLWMWRVVWRLDEARQLGAELAVTQERLRFAADLHDIQGHHLQVIALKAELAERTMGSAPEQAAAQLSEIRIIAKEAMEETRSLVAGLREVGLQSELENVSEVLTLSGAACTLAVSSDPAAPEAQRVLAFAVREATTNILRHSSASWAAISLTDVRGGTELVVTNDGVAGTPERAGGGSGLVGLRKRVQAIGGTLDAVAGAERGSEPAQHTFELRVWIPEGVST